MLRPKRLAAGTNVSLTVDKQPLRRPFFVEIGRYGSTRVLSGGVSRRLRVLNQHLGLGGKSSRKWIAKAASQSEPRVGGTERMRPMLQRATRSRLYCVAAASPLLVLVRRPRCRGFVLSRHDHGPQRAKPGAAAKLDNAVMRSTGRSGSEPLPPSDAARTWPRP